MNKPTLKALDLEALTYLQPAARSQTAEADRAGRGAWREGPATVGVALAIVVLAALAWALWRA